MILATSVTPGEAAWWSALALEWTAHMTVLNGDATGYVMRPPRGLQ